MGADQLSKGVALASAHCEALRELIKVDPEAALELAVPMATRQNLPAEINERLEKRINAVGSIEVYATPPGNAEPIRRFAVIGEQTYRAFVYGRRLQQGTTERAFLDGIAIDGVVALHERPLRLLEPGEGRDPSLRVLRLPTADARHLNEPLVSDSPFRSPRPMLLAGGDLYQSCCSHHLLAFENELLAFEGQTGGPLPALSAVSSSKSIGQKTLLYLRLAFPDSNREPQSEAEAYDVLNQSNDWFVESSFGRIELLSTVTPLIVLPRAEGSYVGPAATATLRSDALAAAKAIGYDPDGYDLFILAYDGGPGNFSGLAAIGGPGIWLKNQTVAVVTHELGHNFGLGHANFWDTSGLSIIGSGSNEEYGKPFDSMGSSGAGIRHFSAVSKYQLGWLPEGFVHSIRRSGIYRIDAFDQPGLDPIRRYALSLRKDDRRAYWFELRGLFGASNDWMNSGVLVDWSPWSQSNGGLQMLDTTPGSAAGKADAALTIGRTLSDVQAGIHVTPISKQSNPSLSIDLAVNFGTFPGNASPTVAVAAGQNSVAVGEPVGFTATAQDPDGDSLAYFWDFGDGDPKAENLPSATKAWAADGRYVVRCLVSDMKGKTASDSVIVTVGSPSTYSITGEVTAGGQPLENVHVFNGASGANYRGGFTDSDGTYVITGVEGGTAVTLTSALDGFSITSAFTNPLVVNTDIVGADFNAERNVLVSIVASDAIATEGVDSGTFTLSRTGETAEPLIVALASQRGTASRFEYDLVPPLTFDFSLNSNVFVIPAGQATLDVTVSAIGDEEQEGAETVELVVGATTGYQITGSESATITILDTGSNLPTVSIEPLDSDASEQGDGGSVVIRREGAADVALPVNLDVSGSATGGADYAVIANPVVIPIGEESVTLPITPIDDSEVEGGEDIVIAIATGADYVNSAGQLPVQVFLTDDDVPTVTIEATDSDAAEAAGDPATLVVSRSGDTSTPLSVEFAVGGDAQHGVDYLALPRSVTIPAGASSAPIVITPIDDAIGEPEQTAKIQLRSTTRYAVGDPSSAEVTIADDDPPVVTIGVSDGVVSEPADGGQFTFTTRGSGSGTIDIYYTVSGTASTGVDYVGLPGVVTMGRNATATLNLSVLDDGEAEDLETVTVSIASDSAYSSFLDTSATIQLVDDDQNVVSIRPASVSPTTERDGASLGFSFRRTGSTANPLLVPYTVSGTATNGVDYQTLAGTFTIPAGQAEAVLNAIVIDDGFDLQLTSVEAVADLATTGESLVIAARVGEEVHVRIFDAAGAMVVDKPENELLPGTALTNLDELLSGMRLSFPWVFDASELPSSGRSLLIVGLVFDELHIRIFDAAGAMVVDKPENELLPGPALNYLKDQFIFGPPSLENMPLSVKQQILDNAALASAHSLANPTPFPSADDFPSVEQQSFIDDSATAADYLLDASALEGTETITLSIDPSANYGIGVGSATRYLDDDEVPAVAVGFASDMGSGLESIGTAELPVVLDAPSTNPVTVEYRIAGGSATGGIDYVVISGVLEFDPGETAKTISLPVIDDSLPEPDQTVVVELVHPWGAALGTATYTFTIVDGVRVTPGTPLASTGFAGGPFAPAGQTYTIQNTGDSPIDWEAEGDANWLDISPASGSLPAGGSADVLVGIGVDADTLLPQTYSSAVTFTNSGDGSVITVRDVSLEVLLGAPELLPEPLFTGGAANTIEWMSPVGAEFVELQHASDPGFTVGLTSSGLLPASQTSFEVVGLADGSIRYYRARATRAAASPPESPWSVAQFSTQDATAPAVATDALPMVTTETGLTLQGTAVDLASGVAALSVNGIGATTGDGFATWSVAVPLAPGGNSLDLIATDQAEPANALEISYNVYRATDALDFDNDGLPDAWEFENGLDPFDDGTGSADNGPLGDIDLDGLANLLEFAINNDPRVPDTLPMTVSVETDPVDSERYFTVQFVRRIGSGLAIDIEFARQIGAWEKADPENSEVVSTVTDANGLTETVVLRVLPSLDSVAEQRLFSRLTVSSEP